MTGATREHAAGTKLTSMNEELAAARSTDAKMSGW